jgi:hypothetical protein
VDAKTADVSEAGHEATGSSEGISLGLPTWVFKTIKFSRDVLQQLFPYSFFIAHLLSDTTFAATISCCSATALQHPKLATLSSIMTRTVACALLAVFSFSHARILGVSTAATSGRQNTPSAASAVLRLRGGEADPKPVTKNEVLEVQKEWAAAIVRISKVHKDGGDYIAEAADAAGKLYAYGHSNVLFKPTKARQHQFRPTAEEAMSYFVGGKAIKKGYAEDGGFAINGGKGWKKCVYKNHQVEVKNGVGLAMGTYDFTCATTGEVASVEYTFGYTRCDDGNVRIFLHHSSVPYSG